MVVDFYYPCARIRNTLRLQESNDYYGGSSFKEVPLSPTSVPLNISSSMWMRCSHNLDMEIQGEILTTPILSLKKSFKIWRAYDEKKQKQELFLVIRRPRAPFQDVPLVFFGLGETYCRTSKKQGTLTNIDVLQVYQHQVALFIDILHCGPWVRTKIAWHKSSLLNICSYRPRTAFP